MPNIPNLPGVPNLSSYSASTIILMTADILRFFGVPSVPQWGIFRSGIPVLVADSVVSFEIKQDFSISDYPVEQGSFQSYNKVQLPTDIRVQLACGGDDAKRQAFLYAIDAVINTTDLYDVVTPERVYVGYNFSHRDFRRNAKNGVGLLLVDLWMTEIRQTGTATFTNTQQPGVAGAQATGNVQPQEPSPAFVQAFDATRISD